MYRVNLKSGGFNNPKLGGELQLEHLKTFFEISRPTYHVILLERLYVQIYQSCQYRRGVWGREESGARRSLI